MKNLEKEISEKCVFRYRAMNKNTMKEVLDAKIWHSTTEGLNDPFEFPISLDWQELERKDVEILTKYALKFDIFNHEEILHLIFNDQIELLYKTIKDNLEKLKSSLPDYYNSLILCCFSKNYDSPLMWSHYSDGMRGVCIAYNKAKLEASELFKLYPVMYNKVPIKFNYTHLKLVPIVDDFKFYDYEKNENSIATGYLTRLNSYDYLYQKHERWDYEKELRNIIDPDALKSKPMNGDLIEYPSGAIEAIIIGSKMKAVHKRLVLKYCSKNQIPVLVATPNVEDYSVRVTAL
ncbi:DUF2971 domain-containing protein [Vibrio vulnificus]